MSTDSNTPQNPDGTIELATAKRWAENWRTYLSTSEQAFEVRSFLIPVVSLNTLLTNSPTLEGVRAYIGLDNATDPTSAKMVLVPIVNGEEVHTLPGEYEGGVRSATVDMLTPCPPYCPTGGGITLES